VVRAFGLPTLEVGCYCLLARQRSGCGRSLATNRHLRTARRSANHNPLRNKSNVKPQKRRRLVSAVTSYGDEAKRSAEDHVRSVNRRMSADQQSIFEKDSLYANSGGAGLAARFNREETMRARAVLGLKNAKSVLETGLLISQSVAAYLTAKRAYLASDGNEPPLSKMIGLAYASYASLPPLRRAVRAIDGAGDIESADQRFNRLSELVASYNSDAAKLGSESIAVPRPVAPIPVSTTADAAEQSKVRAPSSPVFTKAERKIMATYDGLNEQCRGGGFATEEEGDAVCAKREAYSDVVFNAGLCLGREEQATVEFQWHRCDSKSYATRSRASNER
jgi:hypothetical protein